MEKREVRKRIYTMILPIIIENVLQLGISSISMSMIGRINVLAVGAQGLSNRIIGILWCLFKGISIGQTVLVAKAYGAKDYEKLKKVTQQTLISSLILVVICQQIIFWNAGKFLSIFNPTPDLLKNGVTYLRIISLGLPFSIIMYVSSGMMQGMGNSKIPMLVALTMNIANVILSYLLIFGNIGFPALGLNGAGISIVLSQFIGALVALNVLFGKNSILHKSLDRSSFKLDFGQVVEILKIGIPSSLETIFWELSAIVLSKVILTFGEVAFAANQLGLQAESISEMPALGFGIAATAFAGQALGAQDSKLGKQYIREITKGAMIIVSFGTLFLVLFPQTAMRIFTDDPEVIKLGAIYVRLMGFIQIPQNVQRVFNGALKGAGYTRIPMYVAGAGLWGIRIPCALLLTHYFKLSIVAIWAVICVDQVFRFLLSYFLYRKKDIFKEDTAQANLATETYSG